MSQQKSKPVTKGYYTIGNNAKKLAPSKPLDVKPVILAGTEFNKGYYSIGKNKAKLPSEAGYIPVSGKRAVATKGYYSIGNNARKLEQ